MFPFGWGEINGTHNRTDFDLKRHQEYSKRSMEYFDSDTNEKYIPYIIESTYGLDRILLAVLFESLIVEKLEGGDTRQVLKIKPFLAPIKVNILPLIKKNHSAKAKDIYNELKKHFMVSYDDAGNIGKRYRRGDAIGIPYAITIDNNTIENDTVTVRERDSMEQSIINVKELKDYLSSNVTRFICVF